MDNPRARNAAAVWVVCNKLTDQELVRLNLVVQSDFGDPCQLPFFDKIAALFTESGGTRMDEEIKEALACVVLNRLERSNAPTG